MSSAGPGSTCTYDNAQTYIFPTPTTPQVVVQIDKRSMAGRRGVFIYNKGSSTIEIAPNNSNLEYGQGQPILPGMGLNFPWSILVQIFGICAPGQSTTLAITDTGR